MLDSDADKVSGMSVYIDGKMKRYNLLFAVNGGAFALARLTVQTDNQLLGHLHLWQLALGCILFTILMVIDIYEYAIKMRTGFLGDLAFNRPGKFILIFLGFLIMAGWILAALPVQ